MLDETDAPPAPPRPDTLKAKAKPAPPKLDAPKLDGQGRNQDFFRSVDSAPTGVSVARPRAVQDTALIGFAFLAVILLAAPEIAGSSFGVEIPRDFIGFTADRLNAVLPVRTFLISFFLTYAVFAYGSVGARLKLAGLFLAKFAVVCAIVDGASWASWHYADAVWPIHFQQFLVGIAGLAIFPHTLISNARLPVDSGVPNLRTGKSYEYFVLLVTVTIAALIAILVATQFEAEADYLRSVAILGGMGPGVFLAQQVMGGQLALIGWIRNYGLAPPRLCTAGRRADSSP